VVECSLTGADANLNHTTTTTDWEAVSSVRKAQLALARARLNYHSTARRRRHMSCLNLFNSAGPRVSFGILIASYGKFRLSPTRRLILGLATIGQGPTYLRNAPRQNRTKVLVLSSLLAMIPSRVDDLKDHRCSRTRA